ncbi:flagellar basal body rod C-terminal domain-containing protein, partial [Aliarcobacter butzleri]|uniref:flagellar basal body rod C-terminal domain-containing protein n=1 Tax=Aliarcobacter butzleri TaxID=28197 RepID=UPI003AF545A5
PVLTDDPTLPEASATGYVAYPDIHPVIEMVNLIEAMRSYDANVTPFNTHRGIDSKTLVILNS